MAVVNWQDDDPLVVEDRLEISVSEFEKRGDGLNSYVVFRVVTKVGVPFA